VIKSLIRKKILKVRKNNYYKSLLINPNKILKILNSENIKRKTIGAYYPYNFEMDIIEILKILKKKKYQISLPKISKKNQMNFFKWSFKEPLSINTYGIPEPMSKKVVYPSILLIPLVAFDKDLNRLGYGGGYYDRYISKILKKNFLLTIGLGYSFQKVNKLPTNKHDIKLNYIITEKNIYK
jgi:5-formyltetrahydrofolate cyclo-ligase